MTSYSRGDSAWLPTLDVDFFEASDDGRIRNRESGNVLYGTLRDDGYFQLSANLDGRTKTFYRHKLVWEAFNGEIPDGHIVIHIDGDRTNDRIDNLELVTRSEFWARRREIQRQHILNDLERDDPMRKWLQ